MIIIKLSGGLGNQMYQYALYRKFQIMGVDAKLSVCNYLKKNETVPSHGSKYLLKGIFPNIKEQFTNAVDEKRIKKYDNRLIKSLALRKLIPYYIVENIAKDTSNYNPKILELNNACLDGYWQSTRYFEDILPILRGEFQFRKLLDDKNKDLIERMEGEESVSIHVRRGDYLAYSNEYAILDLEYYSKAISKVKKMKKNISFYVFSDDIEWCRKNFNINATYVDWNNREDSYIDMQLMSHCKINIVANSTFSIWAALLNGDRNHIVVRPSKYTNSAIQKSDRWPESWIEIE